MVDPCTTTPTMLNKNQKKQHKFSNDGTAVTEPPPPPPPETTRSLLSQLAQHAQQAPSAQAREDAAAATPTGWSVSGK